MINTVAILGRPNVGKSTLFNRIIGHKKAIVDDISGVTRDRLYGMGDWNGKSFNIIDTGGWVPHSEDIFEAAIRRQVKIALEEASVVIFMTDVTTGITDLDSEVAGLLRRSKKPVILAVNKVDNFNREIAASEFYGLGFKNTFFLSSITGGGTGELLDEVVKHLADSDEEEKDGIPKFAIVGRPNVGKSSLVNALLGEERNIVTDIAGTTRDSIHTHYKLFQKEFILIDTAGIRKKDKVHEDLEFYSVIRAVNAIDEADVCLLMIDALEGLQAQDVNILSLAERKKKGVVILVNKWDAITKETKTVKEYTETVHKKIAPFTDVPVIFISALQKQRIHKAIETALEVYQNRQRKIPTSQLNDVMLQAIAEVSPPAFRGHLITIKFVTQLPTNTPSFIFFTNFPKEIHASYKNYLEKKLRASFNFNGVPLNIFFRKK
jgi:GTPase